MKNIKYSIYGKSIVVTQEEHYEIQKARQEGHQAVTLRGGNLGIPLTTPWLFVETNEPTQDQELETKPFNLPSQQLPPPVDQEKKNRRVASMIKWAKDNGLYKPVKDFSD